MGGSFNFCAVQLRAFFPGQRRSEAHPKLLCYRIFRLPSRPKGWPEVTTKSLESLEQRQGSSAESEEGRLLIKQNTFPCGTFPTQSGCVRVPRLGEYADKLHAWPLFICDKSRMR
jgi:hypothetical protein